ncbi:MAG TPA: phage holin family protein [Methylophilaceae bacterium]|nr:phage holin family protein [Methylophilaceae bacterium]
MQSSVNTEPSAPPAANGVNGAPGLMDDVKSLWTEVRGLTHDHLQLAALETKLAGESLVSMIAAGVIVAVLLVTAWLGLVGAAVLALIHSGMLASIAMLLAVVVNVIVALVLFKVILMKSQNLRWAATLRSLKPRPAAPKVQPATDYLNTGKPS